jgi:hypothetical protein
MRDEILKKLDAFVETHGDRKVFVGVPFVGVAAAWAALRAELCAERCDACRRSSLYSDFLPEDFLICQLRKVAVRPSFYCDDFAKKEPA